MRADRQAASDQAGTAKPVPRIATVSTQGSLLTVKIALPHFRKTPPLKRGKVMGFTRPARLRMLKTIAMIDWRNVGKSLLITLTYPNERMDRTFSERTRDRNNFLLGLERELGKQLVALWRMEWQVRKSGERQGEVAPHFHLVVLGSGYIDWRLIRKLWARCLAWDGYLATDVRSTQNGLHAARYAAKYAAKQEDLSSLDYASYLRIAGRSWGIARKPSIPWATEHVFEECKPEHINRAMDLASRLLGRHYLGSFFALTELAFVHFKEILGPDRFVLDYTGDPWQAT